MLGLCLVYDTGSAPVVVHTFNLPTFKMAYKYMALAQALMVLGKSKP